MFFVIFFLIEDFPLLTTVYRYDIIQQDWNVKPGMVTFASNQDIQRMVLFLLFAVRLLSTF